MGPLKALYTFCLPWQTCSFRHQLGFSGKHSSQAPITRQCRPVDFLWSRQRFRTIAVFPINWERLDAGVFMPTLPATKRKSRTCATRATDVISERKHCSRRRRQYQTHTGRTLVYRVNAQTKRRQSHVNAGTVPESKNAGT